MSTSPVGIFVYGTLKQGGRNFYVAQQAGWMASRRAWIEGFRVYHLQPSAERVYSYPALLEGAGQVWGEIQTFANLEQALLILDKLEDVGGEYRRIAVTVRLDVVGESHGFEAQESVVAWAYAYSSAEALEKTGAVWVEEGEWDHLGE